MKETDHQVMRAHRLTQVKMDKTVQQQQRKFQDQCPQRQHAWLPSDDVLVPLIRLKRENNEVSAERVICPMDLPQVIFS